MINIKKRDNQLWIKLNKYIAHILVGLAEKT